VPGAKPLQRRVQLICRELGNEPRTVCSSNLIFVRSRDRTGFGFPLSADICWPVHASIIQIVRPRLILSFDAQVYGYVGKRFAGRNFATVETIPSGHGDGLCRRSELSLPYDRVHLVQLPHLSRFAINRKPAVAAWLRELLIGGVESDNA
jgi:hypothetical protein